MKITNLIAAAAVVLSSAAMAQDYHAANAVNGYEQSYGDDNRQVPCDEHGQPQYQQPSYQHAQYQPVQYQPQYTQQQRGYYTQVWVPQTCTRMGYRNVCSGGYYTQQWVAPAPVVVVRQPVVTVHHRFGRRIYR